MTGDTHAVSDAVFEGGSAVTCPDCGGKMDYLSEEWVKCTDCEHDYSHYYEFASAGKRHELRDPSGELVTVHVEREVEDGRLVTDGGSRPGTRTESTYLSSRKSVVRSCPNGSHVLVGDPDADCPNCGAGGDDQ
jgi:hypothetical protein